MFTCVDCGQSFIGMNPPGETRDDDPEPWCCSCIEKMLNKFDAEPLDDDTIERILAKVRLS